MNLFLLTTKSGINKALACVLVMFVLLACETAAHAGDRALPTLRDFRLTDAAGESHTLADYREHKLIVLLFLGTECPVSNGYAPEFRRIVEEYAAQNVAVLGVHSDPSVTAKTARDHAAEYRLPFPILLDARQEVAHALGITTVPETVVLLPTGTVIYRGRVDDRYSADGKRRDTPRSQELRAAITAGLAGKSPAITQTKAFGCLLPTASKP